MTAVQAGPKSAVAALIQGYLDHLAVERGSSANTLSSYRRDLARYQDYLLERGIESLTEVDAGTVAGFLAALREGDPEHPPLSASSAARAVVAVRGLHRFGYTDGQLGSDVARSVKPPAPPRRLPKAIPIEDTERLLEAAGFDQTPLAIRDRALLEVLYGTGARISEAVGLDVDDLDIAGRTVLLRGKGGKQRMVPLGSYAARALEAYLVRVRPELARTGVGTPKVFLNARGGPLSRQSAWTVLRGAAEKAGLDHRHLTAHAAPLLRHPPDGGGRRRAGGAGTARPRLGDHHPDLHAGDGGSAARGVRGRPPPREGAVGRARRRGRQGAKARRCMKVTTQ